jgi:hypothetical protein
MSYTALDSLIHAGYTEREAMFVLIVAVHSGYFLRRQFIECVKRERGGVATSFLRKAIELGHVIALPCAEDRFVYHLRAKRVYQMADLDDSQNRRLKSTLEIRRRLIVLDYVLRHLGREKFIESDNARRQLFASLEVKPEVEDLAARFLQSVPISFVEAEDRTVRFAFVDEAQRSASRFGRFLETYGALIRRIERAEVAYVSDSSENFASARHLFERNMPLKNSTSPACPLGVDHLVRWLEVRHKFHVKGSSIDPSQHRLLLEGECVYRAPVHTGLIASWNNGAMNAEKVRRLFHRDTHHAQFVTELIEADYPRFSNSSVGRSMGSFRGQVASQNMLFDNEIAESEGG